VKDDEPTGGIKKENENGTGGIGRAERVISQVAVPNPTRSPAADAKMYPPTL
jgi:hypothetical protein